MTIVIILLVILMGAGAVNTVFRGGETDGICKYGYKEEDSEKH